jgi:hypothetical protein
MSSSNGDNKSDNQLLMLYRVSRSTGWMAFFTLVIAIGSAACAYFFWQQQNIMQDQLDNMQDLSSKIEKSLNVANTQSVATSESAKSFSEQISQNIEATKQLTIAVEKLRAIGTNVPMLSLDRPWVGVDSVSVTPLLRNRSFTITANIRNSGRSPAIGVRMAFKTATPSTKEFAAPNIEECGDCARSILLPNASTTQELTIDGDVLSADKISSIMSGDDKILLFGRIDYTDLAENHHTTTVCMAYVTSRPGFRNCVSGNRVE